MAIKIFGWVLLIAGIILIGWTLLSTYNIFTGKVATPEIFKLPEAAKAPVAEEKITGIQDIQDIQAQIEKMIGEQLKGIIPVETLPKLLNLIVWSILAGLLIFGGAQISSLGIKLIKK